MWETWVQFLARKNPQRRNGNLLQNSCQGNPMDRGAWLATVLGVAKESDTTQKLPVPYTCSKVMIIAYDFTRIKDPNILVSD